MTSGSGNRTSAAFVTVSAGRGENVWVAFRRNHVRRGVQTMAWRARGKLNNATALLGGNGVSLVCFSRRDSRFNLPGANISQGLDPHLTDGRQRLNLPQRPIHISDHTTKVAESSIKQGTPCVKLFRVDLFSIRDGSDSDVIFSQARMERDFLPQK